MLLKHKIILQKNNQALSPEPAFAINSSRQVKWTPAGRQKVAEFKLVA